MADLLLPFQFPFMQNAFLIVAIVAIPSALLSCYLVLKGWALMGDAVSHAVLPGVVQLHWAVGLTQAAVVGLDDVDSVHRLKFRRPLVPPLDVELTLDWQAPSRSLAFRYELDGALHSSGRVQFS